MKSYPSAISSKRKRDWIEKIISLSFGSLEPKKIKELLSDNNKFNTVLKELLETLTLEMDKDFRKNFHINLKDRRLIKKAFNYNLSKRWQKAFDLLEGFVHANLEYGEVMQKSFAKGYSKNIKFGVLIRLHAKGCLTALEIIELLKNGFAEGAMARWRSLYEIAIISMFIQQSPELLAKQFIDYSVIQDFKDATVFQNNCKKLGYRPYTKRKMEILADRRNSAIAKYGKIFNKDNGWATGHLPSNNLTFAEIEKHINFEQFRPYYKMANHNVHADPISIMFRLGVYKQNKVILAGPSNYGLADPGKNTAYALFWLTLALYSFEKFMEGSIFIKISEKLVCEIGDVFMKIQSKIEMDEKKLNKKQ